LGATNRQIIKKEFDESASKIELNGEIGKDK
jgi:hypothetical protein